jgi:hypothetical protein
MAGQKAQLNSSLVLLRERAVSPMRITWSQAIAAAIILIAAAHFVLFGHFLFRTAITSPISDMFTYIADYLRFRAGLVGLLDYLWQPHGEHRLVWIRLLTWADVELFHTRGIPFMAAATASIGATALLVWNALRCAEPKLGAPLALLAPMLVLTSANVVDWSVPINTTYPITVFFVVSSIVLFAGAGELDGRAALRRTAALLAAMCAGLATAAGLLVWPILIWIAWRKRVGRWLLILIAAGAIYAMLYVYRLPAYGLAPALAMDAASFVSPEHVSKLLDYFVAFLGLPFTRNPALALAGRVIGLALLLAGLSAVAVATFSNRLRTPLDRIAIGMIMLALGSAALAAVGRGDLVSEVPVRYAMFTTALHVGLLCLVLPRCARRFATPEGRVLQNSVAFVFAAVLLTQQILVGGVAAQTAVVIARDADCFAAGVYQRPLSNVVSRAPEAAAEVLAALRRQGLLAPRECVGPRA